MSSSDISRRDVLKRGAITTGALVVGSAAMSGTAAAKGPNKRGGQGRQHRSFPYFEDTPWTFVDDDIVNSGMNPVSCDSPNSAEKLFYVYDIEYCTGESARLSIRAQHADQIDFDGTYEFNNEGNCKARPDVREVTFGPATSDCPS